jgi:hypothetical protein
MSGVDNEEAFPKRGSNNYEAARFNALRHGVLPQSTVQAAADAQLRASLMFRDHVMGEVMFA